MAGAKTRRVLYEGGGRSLQCTIALLTVVSYVVVVVVIHTCIHELIERNRYRTLQQLLCTDSTQ